ncbi:MAG: DUF4349 domain-containing protein [Myxococcota bacterium]
MISAALLVLLATVEPAPVQRIAVRDALTIKVGDRDKAAEAVIAVAEAVGGYFTMRSDTYMRLRIPSKKQAEVLAKVSQLGLVVQRSHAADDLTTALEEQRTLLASRRDVLQRYFAVLQTARPQAVTTVEHEMTSLIAEIEELEGSLRMAMHQLQYAELEVSFEFRDRQAPARDGSSSFRWLNSMNLADLIGDFQYGVR